MNDDVRNGSVVAWWNEGDLAFGVVAGEEKQKIRLVLAGGREQRVKPARIAAEVVPPGDVPGTTLEERRRAGERARAVAERVGQRAAAVDVALLWEIVSDGLEPDDAAPPADLAQLADLALESSHADARTALMVALRRDGLYFVRKGDDWQPRSRRTLEEVRHQREAEARRHEEESMFFSALSAATVDAPLRSTGSDTERRLVEALEQLALLEDEAPDPARSAALAVLGRAGIKYDRPHEGAFRALRRMGRFDDEDLNLPVLRYRLQPDFSPELLARAAELASEFDRGGRVDHRERCAISIDSPTTREIDDLVSIEPRDGGGFRIDVHIADPTAFVPLDDPLDREALERGLTRYMPDVRVLMLPDAISERAASLTVGDERPAVTYRVTLDGDGEIEEYSIEPSLVRSSARLGYEEADRALVGEVRHPHAALLGNLARFGSARQAARRRRGALVIDAPEADIKLDADRVPYLERGARDSPARRVVTEAMVLVGEVAARFCLERELPAIYRRQAAPPAGLPDAVVRDPEQVRAVRRSLRRAETGLAPGPHASLGLSAYVQVTSPLRRFQDLATLRQILATVAGRPPCYDADALRRIAATTDRAEIEARRAERAANDYWLLRWLEERTGDVVEARVVEVQPRPIVQLVEALREQPMPSLAGAELGAIVRVVIERVNPRAGLLVLRKR